MTNLTDDRLIILMPEDTVVVVRCSISKGEILVINGAKITLDVAVSMGHKLALRPMSVGDKVLKYGASIGSAIKDITVGDHVHLHNMKSDYTATYSLAGALKE
ncbi:MAG: UxaA family hydrolase [Octadecabacter sp.]|nr:UxaA family hydrolase [Octadecabacter sp.]